jgi:hypothetical protein
MNEDRFAQLLVGERPSIPGGNSEHCPRFCRTRFLIDPHRSHRITSVADQRTTGAPSKNAARETS